MLNQNRAIWASPKKLPGLGPKIGSDVLVLTSKDPKNFYRFIDGDAAKPSRVNFRVANYSELALETFSDKYQLTLAGRDLASFNLVVFKDYLRDIDIAVSAAAYLKSRRVKFIDKALANIILTDKLYQYVTLSENKIPIPKTIYFSSEVLKNAYTVLAEKLGLPFILKNINDNKGRNNFLISSRSSFSSIMDNITPTDKYVAQEFIDNDGDYRLFILGHKVKLAIKRNRDPARTHLNNVSAGAKTEIVDLKVLPSSVQAFSLKAAASLKRDIAGVDVVRNNKTGEWYCFEVNDGPQLLSGAFVDDKRRAFFEYIEYLLSS